MFSVHTEEALNKSWTRCLRWAKSNPLAPLMSSFLVDTLRDSPADPRDCRLKSEHGGPPSLSPRLDRRFPK